MSWYGWKTDLKTLQRHGGQAWLGNVYLNALFVPDAAPATFAPVYREFSYSEAWWKRPAQRAYAALSIQPWTAPWFAQVGMTISPSVTNAERLLISGGNHKLRIFEQAAEKVYGVLKSGSSSCFFEQEVLMRRQAAHCGVPVPPLLELAEDQTWFSEPLLNATPANRVKNRQLAHEATTHILSALRDMSEKTGREEYLTTYAEGLIEQARTLTPNGPLSDKQQQEVLRIIEGLAAEIHTPHPYVGKQLVLAITHGDLQPGNILLDPHGESWLIDWEYAARRQAGYDLLAGKLRPRFPDGLADRLALVWQPGPTLETCGETKWPNVPWSDLPARRLHLLLFLLEELIVQLQENANPLFFQPGRGLLLLMSEIVCFLAGH